MSARDGRGALSGLWAAIDELRALIQRLASTSFAGNPALLVTDWFVDPQNATGLASDGNAGTSAGAPLLTLAALTRRLGTETPDFGSQAFSTNVHMLSDTNATDPFNLRPVVGTIVVIGTLAQVASGTFSAVTPRAQATATRWSATTASFGSWTAFVGDLVNDTTTNQWMHVDADLGGGSARLTQPLATAVSSTAFVTPAQGTIAMNDAFTVQRPNTLHVNDAGGQDTAALVIFQNCKITSPGGVAGLSTFGPGVCFQHCGSDAFFVTGSVDEAAFSLGNFPQGRPLFANCRLSEGGDFVDPIMIGGALINPGTLVVVRNSNGNAQLDGGIYLEGTISLNAGGGLHRIGDAGSFGTTLTIGNAGGGRANMIDVMIGQSSNGYASPFLWGTSNVSVRVNGHVIASSGSSMTAALLVTGTLTLVGNTTGSTFDPTTGVFTAQTGAGSTTLTPANIDAAPLHGVVAPSQNAGYIREI